MSNTPNTELDQLHAAMTRVEPHIRALPTHMREGVREYIANGRPPCGFLEFIFSNDFIHAAGTADAHNRRALFEYAKMLYYAPRGCWGPGCVASWQEQGGLFGPLRKKEGEL